LCTSDGTTSVCCSSTCTDVPCGTRALCNASGSGCQSYADGDACAAGAAGCAPDGHASLASTGTCSGGTCQPSATPCLAGYLCVAGSCATPGSCATAGGCDAANLYTCNTSTGNCELPSTGGIDAGQ
jgi:hypothetical protein